MIPVYNHRGCLLLELSKDDLNNPRATQTIELLVKDGLGVSAGVLLLDDKFQPIQSDSQNLEHLKLGVILPEGVESLPIDPIKFYLKRADKRGAVLRGHPFTSVGQLSDLAAQALSIPQNDQELYFNGDVLGDPTQTLLELGIVEDKVVHVLDTRLLASDHALSFPVELQGSKFPSESRVIEVTGATTIKEFRERAAEVISIPAEFVVVAYCSQILEGDDWTLADLKFVPNALIKILDDRDAYIERIVRKDNQPLEKHMGVHRTTSRDSKRIPPQFEIRRTDSFEWKDYRAKSRDGSQFGQDKLLSPIESPSGKPLAMFYRSLATSKSVTKKAKQVEFVEESKSEVVAPTQDQLLLQILADTPIQTTSEVVECKSQSVSNDVNPSESDPAMNRLDLIQADHTYRVHSAPRPVSKATANIQEFALEVSDIESNHYRLRVSEIDTIRDVKSKLELQNPDMPSEWQDLLLDGRLLEDHEVLQDLFPLPSEEEPPSLFLLKRSP